MRIVFVDDDAQVLQGIRRMLFGRRDLWHMQFYTDPQAALAALEPEPADLVISDLQMPGMDGVDFLEQVQQRFPQTLRCILTGVLDHPRLGRAMQCAHQVVAKPCRPNLLLEVIERAETIKRRLAGIKNGVLFSGLSDLPVMPEAYQKVLEMLASPAASARRLGQLVAEDVGMSARLVQLANSAWFGRSARIHDPIQAVLFLGVRTVEAMVLTDGIFACISPALVQEFGLAALQAHCVRVGMLARSIAKDLQFSPERIELASTAGILHDAGKIVLISKMKEDYRRILLQSRSEARLLHDVEQDRIGASHADLAGAMLQLWAMPAEIIEATACHHHPAEATAGLYGSAGAALAHIVWLADAIDHGFCSSDADGASPTIDSEWVERAALTDAVQEWQRQHLEIYHREQHYDVQHA